MDNGSRDNTAAVARRHGATLLREPRQGYGRACLAGIAHLREAPPDIVVFFDGDGSDDPEELPALLSPLLSPGVDFVVGSRVRGRAEPGAHPVRARWGNRLATALLLLRTGYRFTDLGPFRAIRWPALSRLGMTDPDYGWTAEMQLKAARSGIASVEVPVTCRRRRGRSKISGTFGGSLLAGVKILLTVLLPVEGSTGAAAAEARADR